MLTKQELDEAYAEWLILQISGLGVGNGVETMDNGKVYVTFSTNSSAKALVKSYYKNGNVKCEQDYQNWKRCRQLNYQKNGKVIKDRSFKDNKLHGKNLYYYENGQIKHDEDYKDGKHHGKSLMYYENGQIRYEENHNNGIICGIVIHYFENGQIYYNVNYQNGNPHGKLLRYYEDGRLNYEQDYQNGILISTKTY